ncbi:ABC transporter permease [Paenibacillus aceris]|uniref:Aldouronate transport system permease protein n=1 Tax=Paenibacillus aceris TaxID=869555 RepID=A0ABS4HWQ0_9BACL|nr:ABC transporter permease subunit [Paenibacillus aceris]MBP1963077.1 putative aldouronate transport system permease protein [Paenibacillus aceris]NHW38802.1 sugar ABC transporter permease [Paenibacillus aceris]
MGVALEAKATYVKRRRNKQSILNQYVEHKYFFIMLLPVVIYYLIFHYGPMYGVVIAFQDYKFLKGVTGSPWVGFDNFIELFNKPYFYTVLKNTLIINFYKLLFGFPVPIALALMINEITSPIVKKAVQTISYLPYFLSWVVLSGLIIEILSPSRGPVNYLLEMIIGMKPIYFITDPNWFRPILVLSEIWKQAGFTTIIYLAAIAGINTEMYEAAEMDGISRAQKIWYITLPSLIPVIVIMLILSSGSIINDDFEQVYNLLNVKVMQVGDVLSTYTYTEGLSRMNYSYAAAVGLFKNVVALVLVFTANRLASKVSDETIF